MNRTEPFKVRNLTFPVEARAARFWHGGRKSVSTLFDNFSIFFPKGERFFVASVIAHRSHVTDPALLEAVRAFCGQEGCHGREHERYNALLADHGYPVSQMEQRLEGLLTFLTRRAPKRWQLGVTCAMEHFTSLLGDMILTQPKAFEGADPVMASLWRWHALEENEHKAVAYDVYVAAGGTWPERSFVMAMTTIIFWSKVAEHQVRMMKADDTLFSVAEWSQLFAFLFLREGGGLLALLPKYLAYFKPGFHPWDFDNRALLETWKQHYATDVGHAA